MDREATPMFKNSPKSHALLAKILVGSLAFAGLTFGIETQAHALTPFTCEATFYQASSSSEGLSRSSVDANGKLNYTHIGSGTTSINAIGYNTADNYIYGVSGTTLYKVDAAGTFTSIATGLAITSGPGGGDFVAANKLMVIGSGAKAGATGAATAFYLIDVTTFAVTAVANTGSVAYVTGAGDYATSGSFAYGINGTTNTLAKIDLSLLQAKISNPANGAYTVAVSSMGAVGADTANGTTRNPATAAENGAYGAVYTDQSGNLSMYNNSSHKVYQISKASIDAGAPKSIYMGNTPATTLTAPNDGASCPTAPSAYAPSDTTTAATSITTSGATLNGGVNPATASSGVVTTVEFCYSTSNATDGSGVLNSSVTCTAVSGSPLANGSSNVNVNLALSGLSGGTTYYFQIKASNTNGTAYGSILNFTTTSSVSAPVDTTTAATSVSQTDAQLNGSVKAGGASTTVYFCWGIASSPTCTDTITAVENPVTGNSVTNVHAHITGLTGNVTYYYKVAAKNSAGGPVYGTIQSFTTPNTVVYTVTYDLNGGTGSTPSEISHAAGETFTVASGSDASRYGYSFSGWQESTTSTNYSAADTFTVSTQSVYLKARWTALTSYSITYLANGGGSSVPTEPNHYSGEVITIAGKGSLNVSGKTFGGWTVSSGGSNAPGDTRTITGSITLTAIWNALSYHITYTNVNGTGTLPTQADLSSGDTFTIAAGAGLSHGTDIFVGWTDSSDNFLAGDIVTMSAADETLRALWQPAAGFTVTYLAGAGSGTVPTEGNHNFNDTFTVKAPTLLTAPAGNSFADWTDGNNQYVAGDIFTIIVDTNVVFTAEWSNGTYRVTYALGGGTGTLPTEPDHATSDTFTVDSGSGFSRSGYTFAGWNDGNQNYAGSASYTVGSVNITLTATWTANFAPTPPAKQNPTIRWSNPSPINFGTLLSTTQLNALFSIPGTCVYTPAAGALLPAGTQTLSVTCTPTDGNSYNTITTTVTIVVKKAKGKPSIIWFNPLSITNPTPLTGTQLNAAASVPGKYTYSPAFGTVLPAGTYVLNVHFVPTNSEENEELDARVNILVKEKQQIIVAPVTPKTPELPPVTTPEITAPSTPQVQTNGVADAVTVVANEGKTGYSIESQNWGIEISSSTKFVQGNSESQSRVAIEKGNTVTTKGTGFKPHSQVDIYAFSTPTYLGSVITDDLGNFTKTLPMPDSLPAGDHTFQVNGKTPDEAVRTASVPITLLPAQGKDGKANFSIYYKLDSFFLYDEDKAAITKYVNAVQSKLTKNSKVAIEIAGWVQPTLKSPHVQWLSINRARAVANVMTTAGLKGSYTLNAPGHDKLNVSTSRRAEVTITWTNSK